MLFLGILYYSRNLIYFFKIFFIKFKKNFIENHKQTKNNFVYKIFVYLQQNLEVLTVELIVYCVMSSLGFPKHTCSIYAVDFPLRNEIIKCRMLAGLLTRVYASKISVLGYHQSDVIAHRRTYYTAMAMHSIHDRQHCFHPPSYKYVQVWSKPWSFDYIATSWEMQIWLHPFWLSTYVSMVRKLAIYLKIEIAKTNLWYILMAKLSGAASPKKMGGSEPFFFAGEQ